MLYRFVALKYDFEIEILVIDLEGFPAIWFL